MQRVTKEIALLLKECGYDRPTRHYYLAHTNQGFLEEEGEEAIDYNNSYRWHYSAPTLHEVADWLREVHGLHVVVRPIWTIGSGGGYSWCYGFWDTISWTCNPEQNTTFPTHDTALSAGIETALLIVKERMK